MAAQPRPAAPCSPGRACSTSRQNAGPVVRLAEVAELVDDDVVEHGVRREHEPPVEGERPARRARAPAGALVADLDRRSTRRRAAAPPPRRPRSSDPSRLAAAPSASLISLNVSVLTRWDWRRRIHVGVTLDEAADLALARPARDDDEGRPARRQLDPPAARPGRDAHLVGGLAGYSPCQRRNTMHALWPPKPNEFETRDLDARGRAPRSGCSRGRTRVGRLLVDRRRQPCRRARRGCVKIASTAPAAPRQWPVAPFVDETGVA